MTEKGINRRFQWRVRPNKPFIAERHIDPEEFRLRVLKSGVLITDEVGSEVTASLLVPTTTRALITVDMTIQKFPVDKPKLAEGAFFKRQQAHLRGVAIPDVVAYCQHAKHGNIVLGENIGSVDVDLALMREKGALGGPTPYNPNSVLAYILEAGVLTLANAAEKGFVLGTVRPMSMIYQGEGTYYRALIAGADERSVLLNAELTRKLRKPREGDFRPLGADEVHIAKIFEDRAERNVGQYLATFMDYHQVAADDLGLVLPRVVEKYAEFRQRSIHPLVVWKDELISNILGHYNETRIALTQQREA